MKHLVGEGLHMEAQTHTKGSNQDKIEEAELQAIFMEDTEALQLGSMQETGLQSSRSRKTSSFSYLN